MAVARVPYHLRQNKHIDREIFLDILESIKRKVSFRSYLYVGFGGPFFEDFKTLHTRLGIKDLLSIEMYEWVYRRQKNNVPYGCIRTEHMTSGELIQRLSVMRAAFPKTRNVLCWLDYASPRQLPTQLDEIRTLLPKLARHDILKVTFNANPATLGDVPPGEDLRERRLDHRKVQLRTRLGQKFPGSVESEEFSPEKYPALLLQIFQLQIGESMRENPDLAFQPLGCFTYADSEHRMLTCAGILLRHRERSRFLGGTGLRKAGFASVNWEIHDIDVPYLSAREKLLLDQKMFDMSPEEIVRDHNMWFDNDAAKSAAMIGDYVRLYRYYPHFHRIQY